MSSVLLDLLVALVVVAGLVGAVVQILPGGLLVGAAVVVWGLLVGGVAGWAVASAAVVLTGAALVLKYLLAGRYLKARGVPNRSLMVGAALGVVGFFVIPVVGLIVGFVGGAYLAELHRLRDETAARRATGHALRATGIAILVELGAALVVASMWLAAVLVVRTGVG